MPYEIPASKASIKQNRFEFTFPGSRKVYSVPLLKYLPPRVAAQLEETDFTNLRSVARIFDALVPDLDLFEKFEDSDQLEGWVSAWAEASGVSLGESPASAES